MLQKMNTLSGYFHEYQKSVTTNLDFWNSQAESFFWHRRWDKTLEWDFHEGQISWFAGGRLNITENILDRYLYTHKDRVALLWEPNDPSQEALSITYQQLYTQVCQVANALKELGVGKGDRVVLYMPMVPQLAITALACARIGAIHSVVFAGFSSQSLADRINDCQAKVVFCSDINYRGAKTIPVKKVVDEALTQTSSVEKVVCYQRADSQDPSLAWDPQRDLWYHELVDKQPEDCPAELMDAEDPLFILYTSGSTGKPKGVVHTTGGYMVWSAYTFKNVFQYRTGEIFFCTADIGWITGHSYIIYGPLLCGATALMFEGVPNYPDYDRFWQIVEKHQVNHLYTAPTAIRALMAQGHEHPAKYEMESLRVLGTVGEPINVEAWHWYHTHIGKGRCPIVDTWWQTETGGIMLSGLASITPSKPAHASFPLPGIRPCLLDPQGQVISGKGVEGLLCVNHPWPGMARTLWGDHQRFIETYFSPFPGYYFTGDNAKRDEDGYYRILGRVDDVINVSGHRLGTAEIENAINQHPVVNESAVVGCPHPIKGQDILAFVIAESDKITEALKENLIQGVSKAIGPIAKPGKLVFVKALPKTRSGKIMRRILRKIGEGETDSFGDTSTLLEPQVVQEVLDAYNHA